MAFRASSPSGNVISDCDDDGETAAGGRLLHMMDIVGAKDVCLVVSRWYGGIQLGPDRFKHINNVGRQLLLEHGHVKEPQGPQGAKGKGAKKNSSISKAKS
mmetsp:Transcript_9289/g.14656  ORF Transcript_9289/g.14656 Transcript_9289/m.14656 type:complete len:101 (+) Transcript_9289:1174-1476(+)